MRSLAPVLHLLQHLRTLSALNARRVITNC